MKNPDRSLHTACDAGFAAVQRRCIGLCESDDYTQIIDGPEASCRKIIDDTSKHQIACKTGFNGALDQIFFEKKNSDAGIRVELNPQNFSQGIEVSDSVLFQSQDGHVGGHIAGQLDSVSSHLRAGSEMQIIVPYYGGQMFTFRRRHLIDFYQKGIESLQDVIHFFCLQRQDEFGMACSRQVLMATRRAALQSRDDSKARLHGPDPLSVEFLVDDEY